MMHNDPSPQVSNSPRRRDSRRILLLAALLVLVLAGIAALAFSYGRSRETLPSVQEPPTQIAQAPASSPQRGQGVGGPQQLTATPTATFTPLPSGTPVTTGTASTDTASPMPSFTLTPLPPALNSLEKLETATVPARDPYALAARLTLKVPVSQLPRTSSSPAGNYQVGHKDVFNISDVESRNYYTVTATIRKVTDHAYWYVQNGQSYDSAALNRLAQTFETKIYPTDRLIFGSEWTPGVDNDPRITVLFSPLHGAGGAYSAADEYTRAVNPFSNQREIFYISTAAGWGGLESTLAHEFQHMIHWHEHPNQDIWLNEGSSVLASALNGYDVQGTDGDFMRRPDTQLNAWQPSPSLARANYGGAFLFLDYLMQHYGGAPIIKAVLDAPQSGTEAVDTALAEHGYSDNFTSAFEKWAIANLVSTLPGAPQQYKYSDRDVQVSPQQTLDHYPDGYSGHVAQFGTDYIALQPPAGGGKLHVDFSGQTETRVIDASAHSGSGIYWSNRGDLADSSLTREFDLTPLQSATLDCYVWYDIEPDFDYGYLEVSTDGGATWDTLKGRFTTATNPNGTNYGNAYTGRSAEKDGADANGWLHERIDLNRYAGKKVLLRAEYITDDGYNAGGFALDDISIPELGFKDDAEHDNSWQGQGFVRLDDRLPQSYFLAVVRSGSGGVDVKTIPIDAANKASFDIDPISLGGPYDTAVLIVAGTTQHNILRAPYDLSVRPVK